jgi:hypothetical protein
MNGIRQLYSHLAPGTPQATGKEKISADKAVQTNDGLMVCH